MKPDKYHIKQIFRGLVLNDEETALVSRSFKRIDVDKGDILIHANDFVDTQYYIFKGCLRSFFTDKKGKQHTVQFGIEDWWISDYMAYFNNDKAVLTLETLESSILYGIKKKDLEKIYKLIPRMNQFFRKKLERAFAEQQRRILFTISQPAKERYIDFLTSYPKLEKRLKNYHIASYLGITTESVSRIRREIGQQDIN